VVLAATGATVVAVEIDPRLIPALKEVTTGLPRVRVVRADAMRVSWRSVLEGRPWVLVANLPYNVAVPVVLRALEEEPRIRRMLVMVQREVGERLAARPGDEQFGAVSLRVAYRADASVVRRVRPTVFWPVPGVESVLVRLERRDAPPVDADEATLFHLVNEAFGQRRKTMRNALVRLGVAADAAAGILERCGVDPRSRPEELSLEAFARVADVVGPLGPPRSQPPGRRRGAKGET
jgi:16S rRNA (adenine1518-N6/adenine1519-N6)-dimethyltransferase